MIEKYDKAIEIITSHGKFHICLGLDRVSQVLEMLGNPQDKLNVIHVAGTNGKGSVCSILSNILTRSGYKTGLYTSPHLFDYTERIKIDNNDISKNNFADYIIEICELAEKNDVHLTEFEILTVAAYKYFYDQKVDIAVIETGLGGRLDATNVIKKNLLSVITSISIDHIDRLGNTIDQIALEKAGIIKPNSDVVFDSENFGKEILVKCVKEKNAKWHAPNQKVEFEFDGIKNYAVFDGQRVEFSLLGLWQKNNLELVLEAVNVLNSKGIEISKDSLLSGLKTAVWPARMQYIAEKNIVIDGAHNIDGAKKLKESLKYYFPNKKRLWIYGSLNTKEYLKIMDELFEDDDIVYIYEFSNKNSIKLEDIKLYKNTQFEKINISKAENILNYYDKNCLKIIAGSFYMIGEIFNTLKM